MGVGTFAERISVPSTILAPVPDALGFPEASALPVSALAARLLVDAAAVGDGDLVLITGAAGMVGGFALQLAAARGAREVGDELEVAVRGRWQDGVDACIDTVGLRAGALVCVRDGGRFVTSVPTAVPDAARGIAPETVQVQPDVGALAELADRAAAGELTVRIAEVLPLERFREGYDQLHRGGLHGKVVLAP
jgi:NADPH:quinone reductase-like Zn-dependent oxidoreductase